jgi:hypothetical protein
VIPTGEKRLEEDIYRVLVVQVTAHHADPQWSVGVRIRPETFSRPCVLAPACEQRTVTAGHLNRSHAV